MSEGKVEDFKDLKFEDYDVNKILNKIIIIPGGFGAMKNLSNYAKMGKNFEVRKELEEILMNFHKVKFVI